MRVVPLSDDQAGPAAGLLARAFHDDPRFVAIWLDPEERARSLLVLNRWHLSVVPRPGVTLVTTPTVEGVAIAFPGGSFAPGDDASGVLAAQLGPLAWQRLDDVQAFAYPDEELLRLVPEPHWYLHLLAVEPHCQGRGIGSTLLRAVHDLADADGLPTLLVTFQPRNVPLYRRHGYQIVADGADPIAGLAYWSMRRQPA